MTLPRHVRGFFMRAAGPPQGSARPLGGQSSGVAANVGVDFRLGETGDYARAREDRPNSRCRLQTNSTPRQMKPAAVAARHSPPAPESASTAASNQQ